VSRPWLKLAATSLLASFVAAFALAPSFFIIVIGFAAGGGKLGIFLLDEGKDPNWAIFLPFLIVALIAGAVTYTWVHKLLFRVVARWTISFWPLLGAIALTLLADAFVSGFIRAFVGYGASSSSLFNLLRFAIHLALLTFLVYHWGKPRGAATSYTAPAPTLPSTGVRFCQSCGTARTAGAPFCGTCGSKFA
jgi:hypothetical protein